MAHSQPPMRHTIHKDGRYEGRISVIPPPGGRLVFELYGEVHLRIRVDDQSTLGCIPGVGQPIRLRSGIDSYLNWHAIVRNRNK